MDRTDGSFTEVGNGLMDLKAIFEAGLYVGAQWVIVEQDTCKRPSLESARISIENLRKAGLA
jgi:sugar phosphate isomerase/epimerase